MEEDSGEFEGIGATVSKNMEDGTIYIVKPIKDSPAEKAGIHAGDIIVEVNGQVITSVDEEVAIVSKLKEGDEVAVKVFRPAEVKDAGSGMISTEGDYVDLTVTLAMLDDTVEQ